MAKQEPTYEGVPPKRWVRCPACGHEWFRAAWGRWQGPAAKCPECKSRIEPTEELMRKCARCGAFLSRYNESNLCRPCDG